jgi:hypothetical protein
MNLKPVSAVRSSPTVAPNMCVVVSLIPVTSLTCQNTMERKSMIKLMTVINKICAIVMLVFFPGVVIMIWYDQQPPRSWSDAFSTAWTEWVNMFWKNNFK